MKKLNLNTASAKEIMEHLLVGYSESELKILMKQIQKEWDGMSVAKWVAHINGAKILPSSKRVVK